ncbi:hypothetical protein Avbf_16207 [Armadillidium vulgare]|nr:hypothetical protein Avbf_16207 [Armadillidium vulgare]
MDTSKSYNPEEIEQMGNYSEPSYVFNLTENLRQTLLITPYNEKRRSIVVYAKKYGLPILLFYAMITKFRGLKEGTSQNKEYGAASEDLKHHLPEDIKRYFIREGNRI